MTFAGPRAPESSHRHRSGVEFRVLGPVEVLDSGERIDLGGPKQRAVLALFIANAGRPITTDRLIEAAYGDEAPDAARRSVQTYVSNLRSSVGDMITSVASGYEFRPVDASIDTQQFTTEVEAAQGLIGDDPGAASAALK